MKAAVQTCKSNRPIICPALRARLAYLQQASDQLVERPDKKIRPEGLQGDKNEKQKNEGNLVV